MSNVNSSGKFGTSMDYSMLLRLKKHNVLTAAYNATVSPVNAVFNRDKKTRGFDNGVVDVLFQKGLFLANKTSREGIVISNFIEPLSESEQEAYEAHLISQGLRYNAYASYSDGLRNYPETPIPQEVIDILLSQAPLTIRLTDNTTGETISLTLTGNPVVDEPVNTQFLAIRPEFTVDGNSYTQVITWMNN
jgi:hypothetical protein